VGSICDADDITDNDPKSLVVVGTIDNRRTINNRRTIDNRRTINNHRTDDNGCVDVNCRPNDDESKETHLCRRWSVSGR
jgi:hypothetical protein